MRAWPKMTRASALLLLALAGAGTGLLSHPAQAQPDPQTLCQAAIDATEPGSGLPTRLLAAIGLVESGRRQGGAAIAWPWTINVAGVGHFYSSKAEAIAAVRAAQGAGVASIDVGCMQINLLHHPRAFTSLDEAFDPVANVRYGARFLQVLHRATSNWGSTVAAYHSFTPNLGAEYSQRVAAVWPLAAAYGLPLRGVRESAKARSLQQAPASIVDPMHVMTPEFRARLIEAASFRKTRDTMMGLNDASASGRMLARQSRLHLPSAGDRPIHQAMNGD